MSLRRLARGDLAAFQAYRHDPAVGRWQGWQPQTDAQAAARNTACLRLLERPGAVHIARIDTEFRGEPCVEHRYELARRGG